MPFKKVFNYYNYVSRDFKLQVNRHHSVIDIGSGHAPLIRADYPHQKFLNDRLLAYIHLRIALL
jgi:hypothetical protein